MSQATGQTLHNIIVILILKSSEVIFITVGNWDTSWCQLHSYEMRKSESIVWFERRETSIGFCCLDGWPLIRNIWPLDATTDQSKFKYFKQPYNKQKYNFTVVHLFIKISNSTFKNSKRQSFFQQMWKNSLLKRTC